MSELLQLADLVLHRASEGHDGRHRKTIKLDRSHGQFMPGVLLRFK